MDDDQLVDLLVRVERDPRAHELIGLLGLRVVRDLALGRQVADEGRGERDPDEDRDPPRGEGAPRMARAPVREAAHAGSIVLRGARVTPAPRDSAARSRRRPQPDRLPRHLLRVPLGHDAVARARPLPDLRRAVGRSRPRFERRVRPRGSEALRRHRPDPVDDRRGGLRQRRGQARDPPDEPDPRPVRDLERGLPLRPVVLRLRADPLERPVRLAAADRGGEAGDLRVLARGRPADGDQGDPRELRWSSSATTRTTSGGTSGAPSRRSASAAPRETCSSPGFPGCRSGSAHRRSTRSWTSRLLDAFGFPRPPRAASRRGGDGASYARARRRPSPAAPQPTPDEPVAGREPTAVAGSWRSWGRPGGSARAAARTPNAAP